MGIVTRRFKFCAAGTRDKGQAVKLLAALSLVAVSTIWATGPTNAGTEQDDLNFETYRLADRSNLHRLANGDFLFRLARDRRTGVVYWAYMGTTRNIIAVAPDPAALTDHAYARAVLRRIADLPRRVGCGVGLIHRSWVFVVPDDAVYGESGIEPDVMPVLVRGEVRSDASGKSPVALLSYMNRVAGN